MGRRIRVEKKQAADADVVSDSIDAGAEPVVEMRCDEPHEMAGSHLEHFGESTPEVAADVEPAVDVDAAELLQNQARQLAQQLQEKQDAIDRREAEWQAQLAQHDNELRAAHVWHLRRVAELEERESAVAECEARQRLIEQALAARESEIAGAELERERQFAAKLAELEESAAAAAARLGEGEAAAMQLVETERSALAAEQAAVEARKLELLTREAELERRAVEFAVETAAQRNAAAEIEARRTELQAEIERLRDEHAAWEARRRELERLASEPSDFQRAWQTTLEEREAAIVRREQELDDQEATLKQATLEWRQLRAELAEERERLAAQQRHDRLELAELRRRAENEGTERRQALERQSEQLDFRRAAIRREQDELADSQRETLELRLAAEELMTQLSGKLPPAALAEQMARVRSKLGEQYRLLQNDVAAQKAELDSLRDDLAIEAERLKFQTQELHRWAEARHEELERQAAYLTGREAELERQDAALFQRTQAWRQERFQMEQELRRLKVELRNVAT